MLGLKRSKKKNNKPATPFHIKTGDTVMVITGKDKGKTGLVKRVFRERGRVLVEGVNIVKKATRPNPMAGLAGGLIEMEAPIHASNVMLFDAQNNRPTRIKMETLPNGKKIRVSIDGKTQFDK